MANSRSWADIVRKKPPPLIPTECKVNLEQFTTPICLPPSSSRYSAFVLLPSGFKNSWIMDTLADLLNSTVGVVPRLDLSLLEVCFANVEVQQDFISSLFKSQHVDSHPLPPAGTLSRYVPIKLVNVPVLASLVVEQQLRSLWSTYGEIVELAPHMVKGLPLLTNRWDMVLKLPGDGKPLSATPLFDILGFKVLTSWPGSEKACPRCKQAGHDSQTCPRKPASKSRKRRSNRTNPPATTTTSAPF